MYTDEFVHLHVDELSKMLASNHLLVSFEEKVFEALLSWIYYSSEERKQHLPTLLRHIRLEFMGRPYLMDGSRAE